LKEKYIFPVAALRATKIFLVREMHLEPIRITIGIGIGIGTVVAATRRLEGRKISRAQNATSLRRRTAATTILN
jgi:hypothetical protein